MQYPTENLNEWFPNGATRDVNSRLAWWSAARSARGWSSSWIATRPIEELAVGRYVVVHGDRTTTRFFCMFTDIVLNSTNPASRVTRRNSRTIRF